MDDTISINIKHYRQVATLMALLADNLGYNGKDFSVYRDGQKGGKIFHHVHGKVACHTKLLNSIVYFLELEDPEEIFGKNIIKGPRFRIIGRKLVNYKW